MNAKTIFRVFSELSFAEQAKCLAAWMHALTIDARDTYIVGTEGIADPVRLRRFNELQHSLGNHLRFILDKDKTYEIDEPYIEMLWDEVSKELRAWALRASMEKIATSSAIPRRQRRAG